jgi:hypothetical protein
MGRNILPVWSAEKASVDNEKITTAQQNAGSHAITNLTWFGVGMRPSISDNCGMGRGLRQGCGSATK